MGFRVLNQIIKFILDYLLEYRLVSDEYL